MDLIDFTSQIEFEIEKRISEITKLHNLQSSLEDVETQNAVRRSTICLYYAHIEGFISFVFSHYVNAINSWEPRAKDVIDEIKAAGYHACLMKLTSNKKHPIFKGVLPNDEHLHMLARQIEFFSDIVPLWEDAVINIDDKFINTENNVGREVLQKLLYKVGLDYYRVHAGLYSNLARLLNIRNDIAHGANLNPIKEADFNSYYECTKNIILELEKIITEAYTNGRFLTSTATVEDSEVQSTI